MAGPEGFITILVPNPDTLVQFSAVGGSEGTHCVYEVGLAHSVSIRDKEQGVSSVVCLLGN